MSNFSKYGKLIKIWIEKSRWRCNVALSALSATKIDLWDFNCGCSRHMTSKKSLFTSIVAYNEEKVIFGDGATVKVCCKGTINYIGMTKFENVFYIAGLKATLISISQQCDEGIRKTSQKRHVWLSIKIVVLMKAMEFCLNES